MDSPYEQYEQIMSRVLDEASRDYWAQYVDVNRHQVSVARTYLWVSVAFIGGYFSVLVTLVASDAIFAPAAIVACLIAIFLAVAALGICLYALPARGGYARIGESWGTFSQKAYQDLERESESLLRDSLATMVDEFDAAAMHNLSTNSNRAKLLRLTSWLLIGSFAIACVAAMALAASNLQLLTTLDNV